MNSWEWYTWMLTTLSLVGVVLNIKRRRECFLVWLFTNAAWTVVDFWHEIYAQSALFAIYTVLAVWGWFAWKPTWREQRLR